MNIIELTQNLIAIPSYVDEKNNENFVAKFLENYLNKNLPWLKIEKQFISKNRFNLIAKGNDNPQLIFLSHMDTVLPANKDQLTPKLINNKIYGLGACDMKGGLAAAVKACEEAGKNQDIALIFDCDEEYYFAGVNKLITNYQFQPKLMICPEPTNMEIVNGCRGVIEVEFDVLGKTAHAGTPDLGINAIEKTVAIIKKLRQKITQKDLSGLGKTTVNLSTLNAGKRQNNQIVVQTNAVPDIARAILDIRPTSPKMSADKILSLIEKIAVKDKVSIINKKINIDLKPYVIPKDILDPLEIAITKTGLRLKYQQDLGNGGFYESAIIAEKWKCPAINFGPKESKTAHTQNEYLEITSINNVKETYKNLILALKSSGKK